MNFNRVILGGNLTRDPELTFTNNGIPVTNFGLAVNWVRSKNEEVDFFDVKAWRELGETIANYKKKGGPILIEGRLEFRQWESQDGSKRNKVDVVVDNVQFLSRGSGGDDQDDGQSPSASERSGQRAAAPAGASQGSGVNDQNAAGVGEEDFDDIPFAFCDRQRFIVADIL